ncbi:unnamed protein product [Spirodela intermedia]|uniref:HVA22-like protein n=1 Tax=Spirodela intermedia TaxID=51605 RepID=A0A7I8KET1_SPIIN|nr:unnamed protein product [Spirodela intermedia]
MGHLWTFFTHLHSLAGPTIMLLYPLYASIRAIESPSKLDDEQWLAYWILYSFLTLVEMVAEPVLYWIPIWYQMKVALVAWLVLPQFRGASFIYERFVREQLRKYGCAAVGGHPSPKVKKVVAAPHHHRRRRTSFSHIYRSSMTLPIAGRARGQQLIVSRSQRRRRREVKKVAGGKGGQGER